MGEIRNEIKGGTFFGPVVQAGTIESLVLPPPTLVALAGLPPAPELFIGRDRLLSEVLEDVRPRKAPPRPPQGARGMPVWNWRTAVRTWEQHRTVVVLSGPPGAGKTALALCVGHEAQARRWYNHQLYLDLRTYEGASFKPDVTGALGALLRALGVPSESMGQTLQDRTTQYRSRMRELAQQGHPVLVVLDNVATHEQIEALLPPHPRNCTLVVGRQRLAGAGLTGARQRQVTVFDETEAVAFLQKTLSKARPDDERVRELADLRALAEVCGHLPLALDLAAAKLVADERMPVRTLVARLHGASGPLDLGSGSVAVRAAFDVSYARLSPAQARLFRLVALHPGAHFHGEEAGELAGLPHAETAERLESLANAHLIAESGRQHGRYRFHDLLRRYARERTEQEDTDSERREAVERLLRHYVGITEQADAWLRHRSGPEGGRRFDDRAAARRWLDAERPALVGAIRLAAASGFPAEA
ncbi:AAA family ATPase, partial [Streptomyces sp. NPDC001795]|uniref:AAA family ATPase n=1 Tax=Streptomyces sp. NPDC001795 TaxID=3154525 RepID=UPI003322C635